MITSTDHVPPPGVATVTLQVTARAGPGGPPRIPEPERIRPERPTGRGRGGAARGCGGAEKICRGAAASHHAATKKNQIEKNLA
jgi:hypothetical protein